MAAANCEATLTSAKALVRKSTVTAGVNGAIHGALAAATITDASNDLNAVNAAIASGAFTQLPVHRGILFGDEALVKIVHANRNDAAELIIHKPGEAGALDPYDQRQSIAVRVKGFGVGINRTEAVVVTFGVPYLAANAFLTAANMTWENGGLLDERDPNVFHNVSDDTGLDSLQLAALPNIFYPAWKADTAYRAGDMVTYEGGVYVFKANYAGGTSFDATKVIKVNQAISANDAITPTNEKSE